MAARNIAFKLLEIDGLLNLECDLEAFMMIFKMTLTLN